MKLLKILLITIGALALLLIVSVTSKILSAPDAKIVQNDAENFSVAIIEKMNQDSWRTEAIKPFLQEFTEEKWQGFKELTVKKLGTLKSIEQCESVQTRIGTESKTNYSAMVMVQCYAVFSQDKAKISLTLQKQAADKIWKIFHINFHSDIFYNKEN